MISNGFDTQKALTALKGRVGWRPAVAGSGVPSLDANNGKATSGKYFQDAHAIVTLKNVYSIMEKAGSSEAEFNSYLSSLQDSVIISVLDSVFTGKQLIESELLFEKGVFYPQPVRNAGKFVGFQIRVAPGPYAVQLSNVSLYFDAESTFNLYLFSETKKEPLKQMQVTSAAGEVKVFDLDQWVIQYSDTQHKGGLFYVGYFQDDLGDTRALEQTVDSFAQGITFGASAFEADAEGVDFDRVNVYRNARNYGLNLEVNTYRDYTRLIVQNPYVFDNLISLMMAAKVLEASVFTTRSNLSERLANENSQQIYTDLNMAMPTPESPFSVGIRSQIQRELKAARRTFFPKSVLQTVSPSPPCSC